MNGVLKIAATLAAILSVLGLVAGLAPCALAQNVNTYILQSPSLAQAQTACQVYGMTMVSTIRQPDTYLVQMSAAVPPETLQSWVKNDLNVKHIELNNQIRVSRHAAMNGAYVPSLPFSSTVATAPDPWNKVYRSVTWLGYAQQPAMYETNGAWAVQQHFTGSGIVAVIDTGIDANNPVLAPVLVPGYDFIRNVSGMASDLADINQSTAAVLEQSSVTALQSMVVVQLNQSTAAVLEQSTAAVLDGNPLPSHFGHGTMVAGLIHLVAPTAKIMPLKAFSADGTANLSQIARAIYYAADNGATVINMSFEFTHISDALLRAINYATRKGVICVASAGNDGASSIVYPAAFGNVVAVGSVNQQNQQSGFSNYGSDLVALAAPGEALVTTYPGNHYAAVSGTSFSAALVSGAVADLQQAAQSDVSPQFQVGDYTRALSHAVSTCSVNGSLGAGCLDISLAVNYIRGVNLPH